jgi:two-component system, sensor histidine kinase and response regulator
MGIASAITDLHGNVQAAACSQRICTDFHRANPKTCARCIESDIELATNLQEGKEFTIYRCKNGMTDAASPIMVEGKHVAHGFFGQFLLAEADRNSFQRQGEEFGFDTSAYLEALDQVPVVPEGKLRSILGFLTSFTQIVATLSLERKRVREAEVVSKRRAKDAEQAKAELTLYKTHLERLVRERTAELTRSEGRISLILHSVGEGIFGVDAEGRVNFVNEAAQQMLGYTPEEMLAQPVHAMIHHSHADRTPYPREDCPMFHSLTQGAANYRDDEVLWRKDGSSFYVSYTGVPTRSDDKIVGAAVVFRGITERRRAEDALQEREYRKYRCHLLGLRL